jgi:hypothetical protein
VYHYIVPGEVVFCGIMSTISVVCPPPCTMKDEVSYPNCKITKGEIISLLYVHSLITITCELLTLKEKIINRRHTIKSCIMLGFILCALCDNTKIV